MKKGMIAGFITVAAICVVVLPKLFTKKQFAEAVADPVVETSVPETASIRLTAGLVGSVEPEDVVYIYPKAGGDVTEVKVKAGEMVEAGQLLCVVDTKQIENAKSTLDSAELALRQAKEELSRQSILYSGGGISQQAYRQYQDNVTSAQIACDNARVNYNNQVSYSQISAPISGIVEVCNIEQYDQVSQGDLICVISGRGARIVSFSVTERIRANLDEGDRITVEKDREQFEGTIYEVSTMADTVTGLFKVKARLDDNMDEAKLTTGSLVKLYVVSESADNVMTVPVDAVYYDGGLAYVYTCDRDTMSLHKVQVEAGLFDSERIEIISGLNGDEEVLTTWNSELNEGTKVRIKDKTEAEAQ